MTTHKTTDEMRARILAEATRLFGLKGYGETSLVAVADAVGIRKPSLLYHYGSKEELREAVVQQMMEMWKEEIPRLLTVAAPAQDRFTATITAVVSFFVEDPNRARLCVREAMDRPEPLQALIRVHLRPWLVLMADYIRLGKKGGDIRSGVDSEAYVVHVLLLIISMVAFAPVGSAISDTPQPESVERQTRELVRIARDALFDRAGD